MSDPHTVLQQEGQSLIPGLGCSILMHGGALGTFLLFSLVTSNCGAHRPIIDLDQTMEVSLIAKSDLKVPERASRAPEPKGAEPPVPQPQPEQPPPVKQSDLVVHKDEPKPQPKGRDTDREQALAELERQKMLQDLMNAPEGTVDRNATDPDGTADMTLNPGANPSGDPEYAAYIAKVQAIFMQHFKPLGAITDNNPGLVCSVRVQVDPSSMRVLSYEVVKSSGVPAYDAAAERAAAAVTSLPAPPDRYRSLLAGGYTMNFRAQ